MPKKEKIFTVSEFIDLLNEELVKKRVIIQGEIGKIDKYPWYNFFSLLDKNTEAVLNCFIRQSQLEESGVRLEEGLEIKILGFPEIYKPKGRLNFQVEKIGLVGEGALKQAFELLKKKLSKLGFFALERKKSLPRFCQRIGLITSQYGKGAKPDFWKHLGNYDFEVYFYDVRVEGLSSIDDIVRAIRWFNENMTDIDALVLIRGGGSWESLQSFNSEQVAKAIFGSKIPVICGVGHESDETIADLVADIRASTPTHAAKILNDPWELASSQIITFEKGIISSANRIYKNVNETINSFEKLLNIKVVRTIKSKKEKLDYFLRNLTLGFNVYIERFNGLENKYLNNLQILKSLIKEKKLKAQQLLMNLNKNLLNWLSGINQLLKNEAEKIEMANPELRLKQGYTFTFDENTGKMIKNIQQIKIDQNIKTKFHKGSASSKVGKISKN